MFIMDSITDFFSLNFLFLLKMSSLVLLKLIFKCMLLKDRKEKLKATKYRLAQQTKNKILNKM